MKIKKLNDLATTPSYATLGAGCFDLAASESVMIHRHESEIVSTGLAFEIPDNHVMLIFSRSGHGFKHGLRLSNSVGVIDADYRGEIKLSVHNDGYSSYAVAIGERIAQALVLPVKRQTFELVKELSATTRGPKGFGSTG